MPDMAADLESRVRDENIAAAFRGHGVTVLAAALAVGIAVGWHQPWAALQSPWPWFAGCAMAIATATVLSFVQRYRHSLRAAMPVLAVAMIAFGAGWVSLRQHHTSSNDLAVHLGDEAKFVRLKGMALSAPTLKPRTGGAMARFDYRQPSTYFPMRVEGLIDSNGIAHPMQGQVLVRVDESVPPFRAGDTVQTSGFLLRPVGPRNPGEFDYRQYAKSLGQAGILTVASRDLLHIVPAERHSTYEWYLGVRDEYRRRAGAWLLSELPQHSSAQRDSLLSSLLLGQRDEQIDGVYGAFQRVGLAHVLAISGFHLGVLAGFVLLAARWITGDRRWHGIVVIAFVLAYLFLVEARMPVLRAGVMTIVASLGLLQRRRLHVGGLCALSAMALLLWRPDQLFSAGFQLTFGVVLGLIYVTPVFRRRVFGYPRRDAATFGGMLLQWLYTALAVSITAWMVALPITMHHFGMISPWGVLLSILTLPLASLLLAIGFLKMLLAALLPSAALVLGVPLSIAAEILLAIVMTVDGLPGSFIAVAPPPPWWSLAAALCAAWWLRGDNWLTTGLQRRGIPRFSRWACTVPMVAWLVWPASSSALLRIDMLSVGDGSCYVFRSGGETVVFDAGSSTDLNVARRSLIPALRWLGVRRIDAIAISHADLDHYSAVVELAEEFNVDEVFVTPQFITEGRSDPFGPVAYSLEKLADKRVSVRPTAKGESHQFGMAKWTWLNPELEKTYARANDGSMVIRIECAERRVLLCGDIQRETMETLMRNQAAELNADIVELPHHGSHHEAAEKFIRRVNPQIVLQSTGWSRWERDRWGDALKNVNRFVTIRDGACWVEIARDGTLTTGRFIEPLVAADSAK